MIPWFRLAAVGAVLAGSAFGGWKLRDLQADSDELARQQEAAKVAHRQAETAFRSAQQFEEVRDAIQRDLRASQARLARALAAPVPQCPALAVGDVVLPSGALDRVRIAAGGPAADPGQPRPAVPSGASAPGR